MPIFHECGRRLDISQLDLRMLLEDEVVACLRGEADPATILMSRGRIFAWHVNAQKQRVIFSPEEGEAVFAYAEDQNANSTTGSAVRGITANRGKVRGRVMLVPTPADNDKVGPGDILFAYSTMVDNLPAMKKAAAFVTESGGLTCHAAVVAREFGVPAIVSYKNAMSDFKDGDMIEVDADNGIVRKI